MGIFRFARSLIRIGQAVWKAEDPELVAAAVQLQSATLFDIATCYDIVKASRRAGVDPKEVADTAAAFHIHWTDALATTEEQRSRPPH